MPEATAAPRKRIFDLEDAPPESRAGSTPLRPPDEGAGDPVTLFREAVEKLTQLSKLVPDLAPAIGMFLQQVSQMSGQSAPAPPPGMPMGGMMGGRPGMPPMGGTMGVGAGMRR